MRINKFVAISTGMSRRQADAAISRGLVLIDGQTAQIGQDVLDNEVVTYEGKKLALPGQLITLLLNKPTGYVCSRDGQGSKTIYDLLPEKYHNLKPVGRLDKDSSGLLLVTNNGDLAHKLTHPKFNKDKVYVVELNRTLDNNDRNLITAGVKLDDGLSKLRLNGAGKKWTIIMSEGRNRQIRRTFATAGYEIRSLHRIQFGNYKLNALHGSRFIELS